MKLKKSYTILILPNPKDKPYRFILTKRALNAIITASAFLVLLFLFMGGSYIVMAGKVWELESLKKVTKSQKLQIQTFASTVDELKKQMSRLNELDTKLRVITNLDTTDKKNNNMQVLGMGGQKEADLSNLASLDEKMHEEALGKMHDEMTRLKSDVLKQELSFQELSDFMKEKSSMWASTPSIWPVKGWLTSGFGNRVSPFTGSWQMHKGIDIAARSDTPIIAPASGIVVKEGFEAGLGKTIKIDHGYGYVTTYGHLSKTKVTAGQRIKRSQVIGYVGNTGYSTGPHLHYEVHVNNIPVNPLKHILD
ncbi:MAG: M23 family metallopeptidase [Nitrospirae bacterium]|nr:M23 family metallopeptidase [Nitrospirota bacterium]